MRNLKFAIGQTILASSIGRRGYDKYKIVGIEARSYLVSRVWSDGKCGDRIDKFSFAKAEAKFSTEQEVCDRAWLNDYRYQIGEEVKGVHDIAKLKAITEMIGYVPK